MITALLYLVGLAAVTYLIYRYTRYSNWRSTPVGRAFMLMKVAFAAVLAFVLVGVVFPDWDGWTRDVLRILVVGGADAGLIYQLRMIIRFQGGFRRDRPIKDNVTEAGYEPERSTN